MKKICFLITLFFVATSCSNDDSVNPDNISSTELINTFTDQRLFRISTFIEDGDNKTEFFGQFTFSFELNNVVSAQLNSEVSTGTYQIFVDDGRTELRMSFPGNPQLNELNDDWYFISQTENSFRFEDSGDIIEFTRL